MKNLRLCSIFLLAFLPYTASFSQQNPAPTPTAINAPKTVMGLKVKVVKDALYLEKPIVQSEYIKKIMTLKMLPISSYRGVYDLNKIKYEGLWEKEPEIWNNLKIKQKLFSPHLVSTDNFLSFLNKVEDFKDVSVVQFGYCWGFSTLTRYFAHLSFYNESIKAPVEPSNPEAWIKYYGDLIDKILIGHATVIPGFKNFKEFSSHPIISLYLKLKIVDLWADRASSIEGIKLFYGSGKGMTAGEINTTINELLERLSRGEIPKILFTLQKTERFLGGPTSIHSVLPIQVVRQPALSGGEEVTLIKILDVNYTFEQQIESPFYLKISKTKNNKGEVVMLVDYITLNEGSIAGTLSDFRLAPENDIEMTNILLSLKEFCLKEENAQYCKP